MAWSRSRVSPIIMLAGLQTWFWKPPKLHGMVQSPLHGESLLGNRAMSCSPKKCSFSSNNSIFIKVGNSPSEFFSIPKLSFILVDRGSELTTRWGKSVMETLFLWWRMEQTKLLDLDIWNRTLNHLKRILRAIFKLITYQVVIATEQFSDLTTESFYLVVSSVPLFDILGLLDNHRT